MNTTLSNGSKATWDADKRQLTIVLDIPATPTGRTGSQNDSYGSMGQYTDLGITDGNGWPLKIGGLTVIGSAPTAIKKLRKEAAAAAADRETAAARVSGLV